MKNLKITMALLVLPIATPSTAMAGGFSINENSAADLGRANSGRVTAVHDASVAFGNPALMVRFDHLTISNTASYIFGQAEFENQGSVDLTGQSLGGDTDGFFDSAIVPSLQIVYPVSDKLAAGLSVNVPYGLSSTYDEGWAGRYQGLGSELTTININPSLAFALSDRLSIGGGVNVQYAHTELSSAVDFGAVCFGTLGPEACSGAGLLPQSADGRLVVEGDDWSFGYNIGGAFSPSDSLTFGAHFRSRIRHDIEGEADFTVPGNAQALTASGAFTDTEGVAELPLPATFEVGMEWRVSEKLSLYANVIHTNWSDLEELRIDFDNPAQPAVVEELNFQDAQRYGVGGDLRLNEAWVLRGGFSFDEGAAPDESRTVRIPDNDRYIYAAGIGYEGIETWKIDAAFNRFDFKTTEFQRIGPAADFVAGTIRADVNVISIGATKSF